MSSRDKEFYDVIIIGAGIAGLSAAHAVLNESDLSVAVIDLLSPGVHNPTPLTFFDTIDLFELNHCIKESYNTFTLHNPFGSSATYCYQDKVFVALDYRKACNELFSRIKERGASFIKGVVAEVNSSTDGVTIKLEDGLWLRSSVAVDASGSTGLTSRVNNDSRKTLYSHVYGAHFQNVSTECGSLCSYIFPEEQMGTGGGWFYSLKNNEASFGIAQIGESPLMDEHILIKRFKYALESVEPYADYLAGAKIKHVEKGIIPLTYLEVMNKGRIIVTGDAAGMATNWTCMGVEPALIYGTRAGKAAASFARNLNPAALDLFQKEWMSENKRSHDQFAAVSKLFWESGYDFFEWAIKNDLSYLSPSQALERVRYNKHILGKHTLLIRILKHKLRTIIDKKYSEQIDYINK